MSTRKRKDERDAQTFLNSLRLVQRCVLALPFSLSRQISSLFVQRDALGIYSE